MPKEAHADGLRKMQFEDGSIGDYAEYEDGSKKFFRRGKNGPVPTGRTSPAPDGTYQRNPWDNPWVEHGNPDPGVGTDAFLYKRHGDPTLPQQVSYQDGTGAFWRRLDAAITSLGVENGAIAWDLAHAELDDKQFGDFLDLVTKPREISA